MSWTSRSHRRPHRRSGLLLPAAAAVVVGTLALSGCADLVTSDDQAAPGEPAAVAAAGAPRAGEVAATGSDGKVGAPGAPAAVPAGLDSPAVVVTGSATLRASDVPAATRTVTRLTATYGGRVDDQSTSAATAPGVGATSVTTVRVPPARVTDFLDELAAIGSVVSTELTRADVSAEVADVESRMANARASVARMRVLLERATKLSDIVMLESEMTKRQSDLEALEARARALADRTSLATLTVTVVAQDAVVAATEAQTGFLAGLRTGWAAFTAAAVATLTVIGALTPFLLLALLLASIVVLVLRRRAGTPPPPATIQH